MIKSAFELLKETIEAKMNGNGESELTLIEVPRSANRLTKMKTLEEILLEFEATQADGNSETYIVNIKKKPVVAKEEPTPTEFSSNVDETTARNLDEIYRVNGKLNVPFLERNARLLLMAGDTELSRMIYMTLVKGQENVAKNLLGMGLTYRTEKKFDEARKCIEDSIAFEAMTEAYEMLGSIYLDQGKYVQAAEVYERGSKERDITNQQKSEFLKEAGYCRAKSGTLDLAERDYLEAVALNPASSSLQCNLGTLYLKVGKVKEALLKFQEAFSLDPKLADALVGVGLCCIELKQLDKSFDFFIRACRTDVNNSTAVFHLVKTAYLVKKYKDAIPFVEQHMKIAPVNPNLLYSLAGLYYHSGRKTEAKESAEKVLRIRPSHDGARKLRDRIGSLGRINPSQL